MSSSINIKCLIGGMMFIMLPIDLGAQEKSLEDILIKDIQRLGEMAVRDNVYDQHPDKHFRR